MKVYVTASMDQRQQAAWDWALRLTNYARENYSGLTMDLLSQLTGKHNNRLTWVTKHESLAAAEAYIEWYLTDKGFRQLIAESVEQDLVDWSTLERTFWQVRE